MVLVVALLVVTFLSLLGTTFLLLASTESRIAFNERDFVRALYIAEAGIERVRQDLKYDTAFDRLCGLFNRYLGSPLGPLTDSTGAVLGSAGATYYDLGPTLSACDQKIPATGFLDLYTNTSPVAADPYSDGAEYRVKVGNASGIELTARSEGRIGSRATRTIEARFRVVNLSPWNTAVFAGAGARGAAINGNVVIAGSVHILGTGIGATGTAAEFSGGGGIYNWYKGIDSTLSGKLPNPNPTTLYTEVRVKEGQLKMQSNSARVGEPDSALTTYQDLVDGVYTNNGFGGTYGSTYVYLKNGKEAKYDVPSDVTVPFPCLGCTNPETGRTYQQDLDNNSYTYSGDLTIDANTGDFSIGSGGNTLSYNSVTKTLTLSGIIKVTGRIKLGGTTGSTRITTINYTGQGTLYSAYANPGGAPSIEIHANILPVGTFPTQDRLGFIAQDRIEIATGGGDSNLRLAGAFFAENTVILSKQTQVAGTLVSNYFDMGNQVPALYQVPELGKALPPGLPGRDRRIIYVKTISWKELL